MDKKRRTEKILIALGVLLLVCGGLWTGRMWLEDRQAGAYSEQLLEQTEGLRRAPVEAAVPSVPPTGLGESAAVEPSPTPPPWPEGVLAVLELPRLELELPVLEAYSEENLKRAVCRYGEDLCQEGQIIVVGHNYKSLFGGLRRMEVGDPLSMEFADGRRSYTVSAVETIDGSDVEGLCSGEWDVTLFTCTADSRRRLLLRCVET